MARLEPNGVFVAYTRPLFGSGPPLMLVHGLGGTGEAIWRIHTLELGREFDVIVPDLRGCGGSGAPPGPWAPRDFVDDLHMLVERLRLDRVALMGHSFGGSIVLAYAAANPERVTAVVAAGGPTEFPQQTREALRARADTVEASGMGAVAEAVATAGMAPSFREAHPDEFQAYVDLLLANDPFAYATTCRAVADLDITSELERISTQVLLIAGELDGVAPPAHNRANAERIPGATFVEVEDCGHILPWEKPEALTAAAVPYLRETA